MTLIRLMKRKTSIEDDDPIEFARVEFTDRATGNYDLRPSTYLVDNPKRSVQVHAEHQASFLKSPIIPVSRHVGFDNIGSVVVSTPGTTKFQFTREVHREVVFGHDGELVVFVSALHARHKKGEPVVFDVPKAELSSFVRERLESGDDEWRSWAQNNPEAAKWVGKLGLGLS